MSDNTKSKAHPTPLDRQQLETALAKMLDAGRAAIDQQIQYVLALSQMNDAAPVNTPEPPLDMVTARLASLVALKATLTQTQVRALMNEVSAIKQPAPRGELMLDLATELNTEQRLQIITRLWEDVQTLQDPLARSRLALALVPVMTERSDEETRISVHLTQTVQTAWKIVSTEARVRSLVALAAQLPDKMGVDMFNRILDEIDEIPSDVLRANAINAITDHMPKSVEKRALQSTQNIFAPGERIRALTTLVRGVSPQLQFTVRAAALKAIMEIRNEDERANALINFAPHLEPASIKDGFPDVLEQALGVAVTLSRRQLRARTLVALAPHLTLDLQGEALAAVHSLGNERDRAEMLAELAPTLPPNMLVASLAVAHTMREQDARVHALTVLAHYAPEHARAQTLQDALAAASNLPHHYERVTALMALVDALPDHLLEQAFTNALETTRLIENENARARALSLLGSNLPERLLDRALEAIYQLSDLQQRLNALISILPRIPPAERDDALRAAIECTRLLPFDYKRSRALVSIAPHLAPGLIDDLLAIARSLADPFDQVSALIALAQNLPPANRPEIITEAWEKIDVIEDGYDRASTLAAIAPLMADEDMEKEIARRAFDVIESIPDEYDQASAISILAALLVNGPGAVEKPTLSRFDVIRFGVRAAFQISAQTVRLRQIKRSVALWLLLDEAEHDILWHEVAQQLASMPLPETLRSIGLLVPVLNKYVEAKRLKNIAYILGLR
jgi:hypothetical protein